MLYSKKHNFIYSKTKKTAGTSIEVFFQRFCAPESMLVNSQAGTDEIVCDEGIVGKRGPKRKGGFYWGHMLSIGTLIDPPICGVMDPLKTVIFALKQSDYFSLLPPRPV